MTIKEKRKAIEKYCGNRYCDKSCPLYNISNGNCFINATIEQINKNYKVLFENQVVDANHLSYTQNGMPSTQFNALLDELDGESLQTLKTKNAKYSAESGDALHNFRTGARADNSTMAQTAWHYWKKHFVALLDKIERNDFSDREDTIEKIQDSMNYLRFIWCISEEERNKTNP